MEVPYLINDKEIPIHTKLIAEDDTRLHKLAKTA